jgi:hypothetical protein
MPSAGPQALRVLATCDDVDRVCDEIAADETLRRDLASWFTDWRRRPRRAIRDFDDVAAPHGVPRALWAWLWLLGMRGVDDAERRAGARDVVCAQTCRFVGRRVTVDGIERAVVEFPTNATGRELRRFLGESFGNLGKAGRPGRRPTWDSAQRDRAERLATEFDRALQKQSPGKILSVDDWLSGFDDWLQAKHEHGFTAQTAWKRHLRAARAQARIQLRAIDPPRRPSPL